jgi:hypothetical protein
MSYLANGFRLATSTMVRLAAVVAVGAFAMLAAPADAAPLTSSKSAISQSDDSVTLVRDGCGRGMRYSNRRGGCVPDGDGRGPGYVDPGAAIIGGIVQGVIGAPRGCPPGTRWSNRRGTCVYY